MYALRKSRVYYRWFVSERVVYRQWSFRWLQFIKTSVSGMSYLPRLYERKLLNDRSQRHELWWRRSRYFPRCLQQWNVQWNRMLNQLLRSRLHESRPYVWTMLRYWRLFTDQHNGPNLPRWPLWPNELHKWRLSRTWILRSNGYEWTLYYKLSFYI